MGDQETKSSSCAIDPPNPTPISVLFRHGSHQRPLIPHDAIPGWDKLPRPLIYGKGDIS